MGGRVWIESALGEGTAVHFTAQFGVAAPETSAGAEEPVALKGVRVLAVDDNATNRRILQRMLQRCEALPTLADSAKTALELAALSATPFDVILTDGHMPEMDGFGLAAQIRRIDGYARTGIAMLTSAGDRLNVATDEAACINEYLTKPVRESDLRRTVERLARIAAQPADANPDAAADPRPHGPSDAAPRVLRVLLAEDNRINQTLARRILERAGHTVVVADNGLLAVEAACAQEFDVVLMDIQMPELDGFEATARIRQREPEGAARLPIIGLTAHGLAGDRERVLAGGMDGYVSKPISAARLMEAIYSLTEKPSSPAS
jgi:CheY-like chemotaxis protein